MIRLLHELYIFRTGDSSKTGSWARKPGMSRERLTGISGCVPACNRHNIVPDAALCKPVSSMVSPGTGSSGIRSVRMPGQKV